MISDSLDSIVIELASITNEINVLTVNHPYSWLDEGFRALSSSNTTNSTSSAWAPSTGDTAWMLFSCALVLFMTMPGVCLAFQLELLLLLFPYISKFFINIRPRNLLRWYVTIKKYVIHGYASILNSLYCYL